MRLVDTNVLVYAVSKLDEDVLKKTSAAAVLKEADLALSVQVLQELYNIATRPGGPAGLTHEEAMDFLLGFRELPIQEITVELFNRATEIKQKFRLSYWDAAILAAARMLGCEAVYSEDMSHQEDYDGIRVINPFSDRN